MLIIPVIGRNFGKFGVRNSVITKTIPNSSKYIKPPQYCMSCLHKEYKSLLNPNESNKYGYNKLEDKSDKQIMLHLWNEMWRRNKIDKNNPPYTDDSIMNELIKTNKN